MRIPKPSHQAVQRVLAHTRKTRDHMLMRGDTRTDAEDRIIAWCEEEIERRHKQLVQTLAWALGGALLGPLVSKLLIAWVV